MRRPKFRASGAGCQNALSSLPRLPPSLLYQKTETEKTNNNNKHESSFELAATHRVYRMLPSVCLTVCLSLSLSPSLSISTTLQTHYKNLFHKISMPAKNDISTARVIDLPKKQNSFAKMLLWPTDWRKSLRNIRELHKILEFQGASFTWQWERPQITVKANSARPNENENESPCCVSLVCSQCALHKASAAKAYW